MASVNPNAYDAAIAYLITNGNRLHICSQEPTVVGTLYSLGNKSSITLGAAGAGTPSGRKTTVPAITDGAVTGNGTATHWAIINTGATILVATGQLNASQVVSSGNVFTLAAFDITLLDAVNA
jgi:hypothetical protein